MKEFTQKIKNGLGLDISYYSRPMSEELRKTSTAASVLILFGQLSELNSDQESEPQLLMTRRTETVEKHKGQMAFPGGMADAGETITETALRETFEEVGIPPEAIGILGELRGMWTPTGFWISPVVGVLKTAIQDTPLNYSLGEIAEAFWIPLSVLQGAETYSEEWMERAGVRYQIHVYQVGKHRIWGATGAMIKNLLDRLAAFK